MRNRAIVGLCLLLALIAHSALAQININATNGNDVIVIDETTDGADADTTPGVVTLNGIQVRHFNGPASNAFVVVANDGDDTVTVIDNDGDDSYSIGTGKGNDTVTVTDGCGTDGYQVITDAGRDTVLINDNTNPKPQTYSIKTGNGPDNVTINDGIGRDIYKVELGNDDDTLNVTDTDAADSKDKYELNGQGHTAGDTLNQTDAGADEDVFDIKGFSP